MSVGVGVTPILTFPRQGGRDWIPAFTGIKPPKCNATARVPQDPTDAGILVVQSVVRLLVWRGVVRLWGARPIVEFMSLTGACRPGTGTFREREQTETASRNGNIDEARDMVLT